MFCHGCKKNLPENEFEKKSSGEYYSRCISCKNLHNQEYKKKPLHLKFISLYDYAPYLKDEWDEDKNGSMKNYAKSSGKKVWWNCKEKSCHIWNTRICDRTKKRPSSCPYCSNHKICIIDQCNSLRYGNMWEELKDEWDYEKNGSPKKYSYSSNKKVWWKCRRKVCHIWEAVINSRTTNIGCPYCSNHKVCPTDQCNSLKYEDIWKELQDEWDYEKNGSPRKYIKSAHKKVWWKCRKKDCHIWETKLYSRTGKDFLGCPCCSNQKICPTDQCNSLKYENVWEELKDEWDYEKNGSPKKYIKSTHKKVWWKCKKNSCHIWKSDLGSRTGKDLLGCPCCSNQKICPTDQCNSLKYENVWEELKDEWDYEQNGSPTKYTRGSEKKVWWKCKNKQCHIWESTVNGRAITKRKCPICANQKICTTDQCNSLKYENIWTSLKDEWDYKQNGSPKNYTIGTNKPVWWKCKKVKSHIWKAPINRRTGKYKCGCPYCNQSHLEKEFRIICEKIGISFIPQIKFDQCKNIYHLSFDFYIEEYDILVELDGIQHFEYSEYFQKTSERFINRCLIDIKKNIFAFCFGKNLLRIPYTSINYIEEILNNFMDIVENSDMCIHRYYTMLNSDIENYIEFRRKLNKKEPRTTRVLTTTSDRKKPNSELIIIIPKSISDLCTPVNIVSHNEFNGLTVIYLLTYIYIKKLMNIVGLRKILKEISDSSFNYKDGKYLHKIKNLLE